MKITSRAQVEQIHTYLIGCFGGLAGIRDEGMLESALTAPFQTFDQNPLYPDPVARAAKLAHGLISNYPFVDGNKRTSIFRIQFSSKRYVDEIEELRNGLTATLWNGSL